MADNPFYPGYQPGKDEEQFPSPVYPGYYTGQPFKPKKVRKEIPASLEYPYDEIFEFIDTLNYTTKDASTWLQDRIVDDWKGKFRATAKPIDMDLSTMDDYDVGALPGAMAVSVSLDPADWTDFKKQSFKTVKKIIKDGTGVDIEHIGQSNFQDFETRVRKRLWNHTLGLAETPLESEREEGALDALGKRIARRHGIPMAASPLKLTGTNIRNVTGGDVFKSVARSAVDFEENKGSGAKRESTYEKLSSNILHAASTELSKDDIKTQILAAEPKYEGAIELIQIKDTVAWNMSSLNDIITDEVKKEVTRNTSETYDGITKYLNKKIMGSLDVDPEDRKKILDETYAQLTGSYDPDKIRIKEGLKKQIEEVEKLYSRELIRETTRDRFMKSTKDYETYIDKITKVIDNARKNKVPDRVLLSQLRSIKVRGKPLTGGGTPFAGTIKKNFLIDSVENGILGFRGKNEDSVAHILENSQLGGINLHSRKLRALGARFQIDRMEYFAEELMDDWASGRLLEKYVWNTFLKPRLDVFTPGHVTERILKKAHYFGLVIDKNYVTQANKDNPVFNKLHGYKFKVNIDAKDAAGNFVGKKTFRGGRHFDAVGNMGGTFVKGSYKRIEGPFRARDRDIMGLLLSGKMDYSDPLIYTRYLKSKDMTEIKKMDARLAKFRNWAVDKFGHEDASNPEFMMKVFKSLYGENRNPDTLGISTAYAGGLQKLMVKLNQFQTKILNSPIGKLFVKFSSLKTFIAERAADLLSKGLMVLGASAVGALAPIMEKFLKPLLRIVVKKVLDYAQTFVVGLARGDIGALLRAMDKEVTRFVKSLTIMSLIPLITIAIPVLFTGATIGSSFSPIDPTASNSGYTEGIGGFPMGESALVKIVKDVEVTLPNGDTLTNPSESISNNFLNAGVIRAKYTVTITPKVTLETGTTGFMYSDLTLIRSHEDRDTLFETTYVPLNEPFIAGQDIVLTFNNIKPIGGTWKNSLVTNLFSLTTPATPNYEMSLVGYVRHFEIGTAPAFGGGEIVAIVDCFEFEAGTQNWSPAEIIRFKQAITRLKEGTGHYVTRLCQAGPITVYRSSGDFCGLVEGANTVTFGQRCANLYNNCYTNPTSWYLDYLFAHESGHLYATRMGGLDNIKDENGLSIRTAIQAENTLNTYPITWSGGKACSTDNTADEDFAETVGDFVRLNNIDCSAVWGMDANTFWAGYPIHLLFAETVLFK